MNLKGAIFDMDGTLLDSMPVWYDIGSELLRKRGVRPNPDLDRTLKPMTLEEAARYLISEYQLHEKEKDIIDDINNLLRSHYAETIPLKPGVKKFLGRLRNSGVRMCVATATDIELTRSALKRLGVIDYFEDILTCGQAGMGKDNPVFFFRALELIHTAVAETAVFEDSLYAIRTAKAAGFFIAGVYDESAREDADEITALADIYLKDYDDWEMQE